MYNRISLGKKIKNIRKSLGDNQEQFGKRFDPKVSKAAVSKWESGGAEPSSERLKKIADLGKVTVKSLKDETLLNGEAAVIDSDGLMHVIGNNNSAFKQEIENLIQAQPKQKKTNSKTRQELQAALEKISTEKLSKQDTTTVICFFKIFEQMQSSSVATNNRFHDILMRFWLIISGVIDYDKESTLHLVDEFLSKI